MEEQLVSFETAKLFHEKCINSIIESNLECRYAVNKEGYNRSLEFNGNDYFDVENVLDAQLNTGKEYYLAPTLSLLQKWLREVHKLHINISLQNTQSNRYTASIFNTEPKFIRLVYNLEDDNLGKLGFGSYEAALEKGILEALKSL